MFTASISDSNLAVGSIVNVVIRSRCIIVRISDPLLVVLQFVILDLLLNLLL
jgi:hypothetical protein